MAWYAKVVTFGPLIVSVMFLLAVAVGKLLKRAGAHYPEARR